MTEIIEKNKCCGCMECAYVCKQGAITFKSSSEGFLEPVVNINKCVDCKMCIKKCSVRAINKSKPMYMYAARNKNNEIAKASSSGGIFFSLAVEMINQGGVVIATELCADNSVEFNIASKVNELESMKGSKYIQSYIKDIYLELKNLINNGRKLLFVGTPCQVNAVKNYIGDSKSVVFIDLVCHGSPSPLIWKKFIEYTYDKYNANIYNVNFRDKSKGWNSSYASAFVKNRKISIQNYMMLYGQGSIIRKSCYTCQFASKARISDITLGDFWGIENINDSWFDNTIGTSMVLINSIKGKEFFKLIKDVNYEEFDMDIPLQMNLMQPTACPPKRQEFWKLYADRGIVAVLKKYGGVGIIGKLKKRLGRLKRWLLH